MRLRQSAVAAVLAAVVLTGCSSFENSLVYHPVRSEPQQAASAHPLVRDVFLKTTKGKTIHTRWFHHPQHKGAVLFCPGNSGNLDHRTHLVKQLSLELSKSVLIFDYPGYGQSEGQPSEEGCYAAADAAYKWLTTTGGIAADEVIIYGESLGGGVAVNLAGRKPHRALVLERTFTSIADVAQAHVALLPVRWLVINEFNNLEKVVDCKQPIFIAYGEKDQLIPAGHSGKLQTVSHPRTQRFMMAGAGHNDPPGAEFYEALRQFLKMYAAPGEDMPR